MITRFLKAKHWQMFLLAFAIPFVCQLIFMFFMFADTFKAIASSNFGQPDMSLYFRYMKFMPLVMILYLAFLYGWYWSVAIGLQEKLPVTVKMNVRKFKFFFFFPLVYLLVFMTVFTLSFSHITAPNADINPLALGIIFAVIIPLHFFAMFCMFYIYYFVAKTIKTVELQREVTFSDFLGECILIMFFPIGVWVIQPTINKIMKQPGEE